MASNKFCPECGAPNTSGGKFCSQCGSKFPAAENTCAGCGAVLPLEAAFCSACGTRAPAAQIPVIHSEPIPTYHHQENNQTVLKNGTEYTAESNGMLTYRDENGTKFVEAGSFFAAQYAERERMAGNGINAEPIPHHAEPHPDIHTQEETQQPLWDPQATATPEEQQPLWDPRATATHEEQQPLWDPRAESNTTAQSEEDEDPKMAPLDYLQTMRAKPQDKLPPSQEPPAKRWRKRAKTPQPSEATQEPNTFQLVANRDGYYDDRKPYDYDSLDENQRKIQWVPLILGVIGIVLFAFVAIQLSQYL